MHTSLLRLFVALGLLVAISTGAPRLVAVEPAAEFLHGLQDAGYGEVAVEYLEALKAKGLPDELKETFDLEMCNSIRISVNEAYNDEEANKRSAKAQEYLDKFLKEHPDHPQVAGALVASGSIAFDKALGKMRAAKLAKEAAAKEKLHAEARAAFEESRPRFAQAVDRYAKRTEDLRNAPVEVAAGKAAKQGLLTPAKRDEEVAKSLAEWIAARFQSGLVDYYIGETYEDLKSKPRKDALTAAAKTFDGIYQENRNETSPERVLAAMYAHMWHGKTADEMGDWQLALDLYEEVLTTEEAGGKKDDSGAAGPLTPLFAQVEYFRFLIVKKQKGEDEFVAQAREWLLNCPKGMQTADGYVGVTVEMAKSLIPAAGKMPAAQSKKVLDEIKKALEVVSKFRSEHLAEVLRLLKSMRTNAAGEEEFIAPATFAQGVTLGSEAAQDGNWGLAVKYYTAAIELFPKQKPQVPQQLEDAKLALDECKYFLARDCYVNGELDRAIAIAGEVAKNVTSPSAPKCAAIAISVRLTQYASAADDAARAKALEQLESTCNFTITSWPAKPEADDARIAQSQSRLVQGKFDEAITGFEAVNKKSARYPIALYQAGQTHWRLYSLEKAKLEGQRDEESLKTHRAKAEEQLKESVAKQQEDFKASKDAEMPKSLADAQLLLAEICVDGEQLKEAAELVQPLVDAIKTEKPQSLDNTALRTFVAAVRAYKGLGDLPKAGEVCSILTELGADTPQVNSVLTALFAKMLVDEMKRCEAAVIQAEKPLDKEEAQKSLDGVKEVLGNLLEKLAPRNEQTTASLIFIADTAGQLGKTDLAGGLYDRILKQAETDPVFKVKNAAAIIRIRAQLVGLLRQKKQFAEGIKQVDALIASTPKALEPRMEKGRILQAWAEDDAKHYPEATAHWTSLRNLLQNMPKKPPQYYEVVYNAAYCLHAEAEKTKAPEKSATAEKLLGQALFYNSELDGPDTVARYKELIKKINPNNSALKKPDAAAPKPATPAAATSAKK